MSNAIVGEYLEVLRRPKFKIKRDELDDFAALLLRKAEFVTPLETVSAVQADPSDDKFLEVALAEQARHIVSGDKHLLTLKTYRGIAILTAREFSAWLDE